MEDLGWVDLANCLTGYSSLNTINDESSSLYINIASSIYKKCLKDEELLKIALISSHNVMTQQGFLTLKMLDEIGLKNLLKKLGNIYSGTIFSTIANTSVDDYKDKLYYLNKPADIFLNLKNSAFTDEQIDTTKLEWILLYDAAISMAVNAAGYHKDIVKDLNQAKTINYENELKSLERFDKVTLRWNLNATNIQSGDINNKLDKSVSSLYPSLYDDNDPDPFNDLLSIVSDALTSGAQDNTAPIPNHHFQLACFHAMLTAGLVLLTISILIYPPVISALGFTAFLNAGLLQNLSMFSAGASAALLVTSGLNQYEELSYEQ